MSVAAQCIRPKPGILHKATKLTKEGQNLTLWSEFVTSRTEPPPPPLRWFACCNGEDRHRLDTGSTPARHRLDTGSQAQRRFAQLAQQLAQIGWISEGYAQNRGPGAGGPCYQWTRKVRAKTVSVALSKDQYEWLKEAIANWRAMQEIIKEMQRLSRQVLFATVASPPRRKRLGKKVLGLI